MLKPEINYILICCCTYKRPKMLKEALDSIKYINLASDIKVEIIVVDNDIEKSAFSIVNEAESELKLKIHYSNEKERGLANVRNKVLDEAILLGASHILFFDDDETLDKNCLIEHIKNYQNNPAAFISSGCVFNKFQESCPKYIKKNIVFKIKTSKTNNTKRKSCASGNVFFPVSIAKNFNLRFSNDYIFMGGEDDDFFSKASLLGFSIVFCAESVMYETIPEQKTGLKYIFKKAYYNGYSKTWKKNKDVFYVMKNFIIILFYLIFLIPSFITGITNFINILTVIIRNSGKIAGILRKYPLNFYKEIYGE